MSHEKRLEELGITLPPPPAPVAVYVPAVRSGNLLFTSGQLPFAGGELVFKGKLGEELTNDQGYQAARTAALNCLAVIRKELGSLDRVERILRLTGYVNSTPGFTEHPKVINGASELFGEVFGEAGLHSRVAVGVSGLPLGAPVEVDVVVSLNS